MHICHSAASVMAEGGDNSTECNDQRQELHSERLVSVVDMVTSTISAVPRSLRHGIDVGISLGAKTVEGICMCSSN